jgi:hypothetical protein
MRGKRCAAKFDLKGKGLYHVDVPMRVTQDEYLLLADSAPVRLRIGKRREAHQWVRPFFFYRIYKFGRATLTAHTLNFKLL